MIKKITKEHKALILVGLLFLIVSFLTPLCGDDWGNYYKYESLNEIFKTTFSLYQTWEGRIVSRFLICLFTYNKVIWNILLPVCVIGIIVAINKFSNKDKNYNIFLLSILGLILINNTMFAQTYSWIAGGITYLYPTVIVFTYFSILFTRKKKETLLTFILLLLINFLSPMFVENIGVALVAGNILYLIYYFILNKKINISAIVFTLVSLVSLLIMLNSPGSASRMELSKSFYELSIIERVLYNKYQLMNYTYTRNIFMICLMILPIFYNVFSKIKSKKIRLITNVIFLIIPILTIINHLMSLVNLKFNPMGLDLEGSLICFIYWVCFTVLFMLSILFSTMDKENKISTMFMFFIGAISICSLLVTPVFGDRTSFFTVVTFIAVSLKLISYINIKPKRYVEIGLKVMLGIFIVYYLCIFIMVAVFEQQRQKQIKLELTKNNSSITIKSNPIPYLWNNNPTTDFHVLTFKEYYNIPKEINLNIDWIKIVG